MLDAAGWDVWAAELLDISWTRRFPSYEPGVQMALIFRTDFQSMFLKGKTGLQQHLI